MDKNRKVTSQKAAASILLESVKLTRETERKQRAFPSYPPTIQNRAKLFLDLAGVGGR